MNMLDRAIGWIAPRVAVDRAVARITLDQVRALSYDGATVGRRTSGWRTNNASANSATKGALHLLCARSRDVTRNTWWGNRIVSVVTGHAVGAGITPICKADPKAVELWNEWGRSTDQDGQAQSDQEGQLTIDGQIALACRTIIESGEVLGRFVPLPRSSGRRVPLELQLLEPDHLDGTRDSAAISPSGAASIVDQGIEYNAQGKRAAFWLLPEHPGACAGLKSATASIRIPARDVLHCYRKERIGQGRGVPWVAPVLLKGRDVADLEEAIVVKARVEACLALLIKTNDAARTLAASSTETKDGKTRRLETMSPAMIHYMAPGEEAEVVNPSSSLAFESVLINSWMTLCAGAGITYDQGTGDLRQANYSSLRAGKIEFRRLIEQFQYLTIAPMLLNRIWARFIAAALDVGLLVPREGGYPVEWIMPANEPIDPLKDLQADILAVRSGRITWANFVAAWGFNPDVQLDEIATWLAALDEKKIVLDTDPRRSAPSIKGAPKSEVTTEEISDANANA